jgi:hypothetical protein
LQTPSCNGTAKRSKREADDTDDGVPATIEVFSGLYVNENAEVIDDDYDSVFREKVINQTMAGVDQNIFGKSHYSTVPILAAR